VIRELVYDLAHDDSMAFTNRYGGNTARSSKSLKIHQIKMKHNQKKYLRSYLKDNA
jgi:hypothetical protein